ncbi:PREDICTED: uncharacterized protein LOC108366563 [Rhagoletis zephyria]|uniref:uncharacterized protein LOC108366563 n=1 Tax=Rhagoletis zephyria TaxID=28612 RepID=UPI0008119CD7|nr:PREDICTED: uncharacterized protein LOC108366563 [Rhagoletis zephyria]
MNFRRSSLILLLMLVLLYFCAESEAKKWRSHHKKRSNSPKISATFRTVPPKRKPMPKHLTAAHKRNAKMNYYHPLPTSWPTHFADTLPPTYYLASNYPRWRSYLTAPARRSTLRKMDLTPPFVPLLPFAAHPTAMRRADEFDINSSSSTLSTAPLVDMSAFNAAIADGILDTDFSQSSANRDFLQPEISLGGWTPVDYKSFMSDADFSLLKDQMDLSHRLDMDGPMYSNPFERHFV